MRGWRGVRQQRVDEARRLHCKGQEQQMCAAEDLEAGVRHQPMQTARVDRRHHRIVGTGLDQRRSAQREMPPRARR
jgi:hypothetical protein